MPNKGTKPKKKGGTARQDVSGANPAHEKSSSTSSPSEAKEESPTVESLLARADTLWRQESFTDALTCYEDALTIAREKGDKQQESMILVGRGYALMSTKKVMDLELAMGSLTIAKDIATSLGSEQQVHFIETLITKAKEGGMCPDETDKPTGCAGNGDNSVLGLDPTQQTLVDVVATAGTDDWVDVTRQVNDRLSEMEGCAQMTVENLKEIWKNIAPQVKERLSHNPTMACGHTCGTCPTKSSCHLHDALDIEDVI